MNQFEHLLLEPPGSAISLTEKNERSFAFKHAGIFLLVCSGSVRKRNDDGRKGKKR
jgi:hypothetical protein